MRRLLLRTVYVIVVIPQGRRKPLEFGTAEYKYKLSLVPRLLPPHAIIPRVFRFRAGQRSYVACGGSNSTMTFVTPALRFSLSAGADER